MTAYLSADREETSWQGDQFITKSQITENYNFQINENKTDDMVRASAECRNPNASVNISVEDKGEILLIFSALINPEGAHIESLICKVHFVSALRYVMSLVLLEHTLCNGGVIVVLSDTSRRRRWNVCSALQAPGPDFLTLSNVADVSVEFKDVIHISEVNLFEVTISVVALEKPEQGELLLRHLSAKEGTILFVLKKVVYFVETMSLVRLCAFCATDAV